MYVKCLTYQDLIDRIETLCAENHQYNEKLSILFTPEQIIISNISNSISHNLININPICLGNSESRLIISKSGCKIHRGGWEISGVYKWNVPYQYKYYDIIDFWIYKELKKNLEIINRILLSRLSYAGNPSETDKFQGFWMGDVRFLYSN